MNKNITATFAMVFAVTLLISIATGCGSSGGGPALEDIPLYPYATESESMEQSGPGGFMGGKLAQFTTTDPFDEVMDFYTDALNQYNPKFISNTSELGRQTAISIPKKNGMVSVAIRSLPRKRK
ncbi:MAG: hypothetical protein PVF29_14070 [Desulfobacterales bacterium]|jgi:hypothetical protein